MVDLQLKPGLALLAILILSALIVSIFFISFQVLSAALTGSDPLTKDTHCNSRIDLVKRQPRGRSSSQSGGRPKPWAIAASLWTAAKSSSIVGPSGPTGSRAPTCSPIQVTMCEPSAR